MVTDFHVTTEIGLVLKAHSYHSSTAWLAAVLMKLPFILQFRRFTNI